MFKKWCSIYSSIQFKWVLKLMVKIDLLFFFLEEENIKQKYSEYENLL